MGKDFALVLGILIAACSVLAIALLRPDSIGTPYDDVVVNRAKWQSQRPATYAANIEKLCYCEPWSIRAEVSASGVPMVTFKEPPPTSPHDDRSYFPRTIDDIFEYIDRAYAQKAFRITIAFDDVLGYPIHVDIDRAEKVIDDEVQLFVTEFAPRHVG
jgi:hypothetical protein